MEEMFFLTSKSTVGSVPSDAHDKTLLFDGDAMHIPATMDIMRLSCPDWMMLFKDIDLT